MDTRQLQNYLRIELNQQSVQGGESEYVNKLVVKVEQSKKKRQTQTKCALNGGERFARLQKLILENPRSDSLSRLQ